MVLPYVKLQVLFSHADVSTKRDQVQFGPWGAKSQVSEMEEQLSKDRDPNLGGAVPISSIYLALIFFVPLPIEENHQMLHARSSALPVGLAVAVVRWSGSWVQFEVLWLGWFRWWSNQFEICVGSSLKVLLWVLIMIRIKLLSPWLIGSSRCRKPCCAGSHHEVVSILGHGAGHLSAAANQLSWSNLGVKDGQMTNKNMSKHVKAVGCWQRQIYVSSFATWYILQQMWSWMKAWHLPVTGRSTKCQAEKACDQELSMSFLQKQHALELRRVQMMSDDATIACSEFRLQDRNCGAMWEIGQWFGWWSHHDVQQQLQVAWQGTMGRSPLWPGTIGS